MQLDELQKLFYEAIFEKNTDSVEKICQHIATPKNLTALEHLAIYRDSIMGKFSHALSDIYPVCCRLVGEKFFQTMVEYYIRSTSSTSPDIGQYGQYFAEFIDNFDKVANLPYLSDVARLEWAWHHAFNAKNEKGFNFSALAQVPESEKQCIIFRLPYSATLLKSDFPIAHIWRVNQSDWHGEQTVDLREGGGYYLIWRQNYAIRIDVLTEKIGQFLTAVQARKTVSILCDPEIMGDGDKLLPLCVEKRWIADFSLKYDTEEFL
jgi:hypothetical protein